MNTTEPGLGFLLSPSKGVNMTDETYEAPTIEVIGSVEELTQTIAKHTTNTPDGFSFNGVTLTS
jgi:hypothetical protein